MGESFEVPKEDRLWTKKETANFLKVSERCLDRWLQNGVLEPGAKVVIGGAVRFRAAVFLNIGNPQSQKDS